MQHKTIKIHVKVNISHNKEKIICCMRTKLATMKCKCKKKPTGDKNNNSKDDYNFLHPIP